MTSILPPIRLSASAVRDYRQCAYRYARTYLLPLESNERRPVRALAFGEIIHATIAAFFRHGGWPLVGRDDLEVLLGAHWRDDLYDAPDLAEANYERARELLARFYESGYPEYVERELGIERRLAWGRYRQGMMATGRIDRACLIEDGTVELIDWKTGRRRGGASDYEQDEQVLFYRSLGAEAYGHLEPTRIRVTLFFLATGTPLRIDLEHEDFVAGWQRIVATATSIRQGMAGVAGGAAMLDAFPPHRGMHCALCPMGAHCDALQAAGKIVDSEGGAA